MCQSNSEPPASPSGDPCVRKGSVDDGKDRTQSDVVASQDRLTTRALEGESARAPPCRRANVTTWGPVRSGSGRAPSESLGNYQLLRRTALQAIRAQISEHRDGETAARDAESPSGIGVGSPHVSGGFNPGNYRSWICTMERRSGPSAMDFPPCTDASGLTRHAMWSWLVAASPARLVRWN